MWTNVLSSWQKSWNRSQKCRHTFCVGFFRKRDAAQLRFQPDVSDTQASSSAQMEILHLETWSPPSFLELAAPLHCKKQQLNSNTVLTWRRFTWPQSWTGPAFKPLRLFWNQVVKHTRNSTLSLLSSARRWGAAVISAYRTCLWNILLLINHEGNVCKCVSCYDANSCLSVSLTRPR